MFFHNTTTGPMLQGLIWIFPLAVLGKCKLPVHDLCVYNCKKFIMHDGMVNLYTAFILGISASWIVLEAVRLMPFDDYFKLILLVVLPIPPILMGLVIMTYGPSSFVEAAIEQNAPGILFKSFLKGTFWGLVMLGVIHTFLVMREEK